MTHDEEIAALIPRLRDSDSLSLMQAVSLCQQAARVLERAQREREGRIEGLEKAVVLLADAMTGQGSVPTGAVVKEWLSK